MPEGHTLHRLAGAMNRAFAGSTPEVSSPQGRFAPGAALLDDTRFEHAEAWGKHLFAEFAGDRWLNVHLGLIGTFTVLRRNPDEMADPEVTGQVRLRLLNEEWVADLRGPMVCAVRTGEEVAATIHRLGPDPLREEDESDPDRAWAKIHRSGKTIAELLMDQSVLAGAGNIYRCEVLFRHRVHPMRTGREIKSRTWETIWADLRQLMPLGVATGRIVTTLEQVRDVQTRLSRGEQVRITDREFYVYKRTGQPCLLCGSRVRAAPMAGRTLYWCGNCQRRS